MTDTIRDLLISLASHMAYMQAQLEAHNEFDDPEDYYWYRESVLLRQKVTDALADEPAVPDEGREPAAVTGQPSDAELLELMPEQFRQDLATVSSMAAHGAGTGVTPGLFRVSLNTGALDYARAVLARWGNLKGSLTSSPPADGEVAELVAQLTSRNYGPGALDRVAELLQRQALVPVPVSERPWEREGWCDAEGKCWICGKVEGDWRLINPTNSGVPNLKYCFTHCLPANALPRPGVNNG